MITIISYVKTNGERSEAIEYNKVVQSKQELNAVKSLLMHQHQNYQIDLIYSEREEVAEPVIVPPIEIHVIDQSGVIERNKINLRSYVESLKS